MQALAPIFEIASKASTPLAVSGLALAVLFFIFRQLLAKNIFPELSKAAGGVVLRQIVDRLFVLALVAMLLGTIGYVLPVFFPGVVRKEVPDPKAGEAVLTQLYAGKYQELYDSLSPQVRDRVPYAVFLPGVKKEMSQFSGPPLYRRLTRAEQVAGLYALTYEAEFDQRTRFNEVLTYADTPKGWILMQYQLSPVDWPVSSMATRLPEPTPAELFQHIRTLRGPQLESYLKNEVAGHWIPEPGWNGNFQKILTQKSTRTCDIQLREPATGALLTARDVLDGCSLKGDQPVTFYGRIDGVKDTSAEVSSVRWYLNM